MTEKCTKYEALFTFANNQDFKKHIETCPDCRLEDEKMRKISSLIQEVKPYFKKRRKSAKFVKAACVLVLLLFCTTTFTIVNTNPDIADTLKYGSTLSAQDLGFPVDSYGLITVE